MEPSPESKDFKNVMSFLSEEQCFLMSSTEGTLFNTATTPSKFLFPLFSKCGGKGLNISPFL